MSGSTASDSVPQTSAVNHENGADHRLKIARARSDMLMEAQEENGPSSPHFYSLSVRKGSPSLDSYISDIENSAPDDQQGFDVDDAIKEDAASEQQVREQAVRLDLLRRQHSATARQTLEQLQQSAASTSGSHGSESPNRAASSETRRSNSGVSVDIVRQHSEQLKQASGDVRRVAEEQRTLAEEAVANFLLQEDMMMGEGGDSPKQGSADAGLSQALNDVFEDKQGGCRTSLTRQLENIRRAEQAIKDAEADERIADQLAALQQTQSQLAEQEDAGGDSQTAEGSSIGDTDQQHGVNNPKASGTGDHGRHLLKDISENSQEGLGSSSASEHMAASAFAAVSQVDSFHGTDLDDAEDLTDQDRILDSAEAEEQVAEHEQGQAESPDTRSSQKEEDDLGSGASDTHSIPLTEDSLTALASAAGQHQLGTAAATATPVPGLASQSRGLLEESQGSDHAGSTSGSQTFDSELHDSISAFVQAPGNADQAAQQAEQPSPGASSPSADAMILQSLKEGMTSAKSESSSQALDAALQDGVSAAEAADAAAKPGARQGEAAERPAPVSPEAAQAPAAEVDGIPAYTLGSDDEDDLTVVSSEGQAKEAQAAAHHFMQSSRPTTPDTDPAYQEPPTQPPATHTPPLSASTGDEQQELGSQAAAAAAGITEPFTTDYLEGSHMPHAFEPEEFKGMLFHDGVDSQGRPVIIVNTDAVGASRKARSSALQYMLHRLEPIVTQGPYILVMVATGQQQKSNKLPAMWLISAYRSLSRPFRKNVRYILLVRPTGGLKALVTCIRPFVSAKAAKKVRQVDSLSSIAAATSNEVTLQHLGSRFAAAAGDYFLQGAAAQPSTVNPYDMPQF